MLFTIIKGPCFAEARKKLQLALQHGVDGVEVRIDTFPVFDLNEIRALRNDSASIRILFTHRLATEGGYFAGSHEKRLEQMEQLASLSPDFIDLEHTIPAEFKQMLFEKYPHVRQIISYHNFDTVPEDLTSLLEKIHTSSGHLYKIAAMANQTSDAIRMLQFVRSQASQTLLSGIAMGEWGQITRILGPVIGNEIDYAFIDPDMETAPGQMSLTELKNTYRYHQLNRQSKLFALIGDPVEHSVGHLFHNRAFDTCQFNGVYVKIPLKAHELGHFLHSIRKLPFLGFSVTMPLKEAIIPFLDELDSSAHEIGAVNTIFMRGERLIGYNTDGMGACNALEKHLPIKGKRIVVLGAGGAAKALIYEAQHRGAQVIVLNRTLERAKRVAEKFECPFGDLETLPTLFSQGYEILVNATPDHKPCSSDWILPGCIVMDMVNARGLTPFLAQAAAKNCPLVHGKEMFFHQAVEQLAIWLGEGIDRQALLELG